MWLPLECPPMGTWPETQACALTGNQTSDPVVHRLVFSPLSHTSQSHLKFFEAFKISHYCCLKSGSMSPFPFYNFNFISFLQLHNSQPYFQLSSFQDYNILKYLFFNFYFLFFQKGEKWGEKHRCKRETLVSCLLHTPWPGFQACHPRMCPTRNPTTRNHSVCRMTPNQLRHIGQG